MSRKTPEEIARESAEAAKALEAAAKALTEAEAEIAKAAAADAEARFRITRRAGVPEITAIPVVRGSRYEHVQFAEGQSEFDVDAVVAQAAIRTGAFERTARLVQSPPPPDDTTEETE